MAVRDSKEDICWYDLAALALEGMGWSETEGPYERLPARAKGRVPEAVWNLAKHSAGICARFVADADAIFARWTLKCPGLAMDHMPATGVSGLDLYVRRPDGWRWLGVGRPTGFPTNRQQLTRGTMAAERREYILYLPLYNGVEEVRLGLSPSARLERAPPRPAGRSKPLVFYGTSIVQGGCASRPGMAYPAILGRWLDVPVINLGFSGSGRMEPEVAEFVAEPDASVFVLDCLPNVQAPEVTERLGPLIRKIRTAHPSTPVVLVDNVIYQDSYLMTDRRERQESSNRAQRAVLKELRSAGIRGLFHVPAGRLLGHDGEATADGTHPTDAGFLRLASALHPVIKKAIRMPGGR